MEQGVRAFVKGLRSGGPPIELELRLGAIDGQRFDPSISKADMDQLLRTLGSEDGAEWRESHDVFFVDGDRTVRTTVTFDDCDFTMATTHVVKERLGVIDAPRYRVAWATETSVVRDSLPFAAEVQHMRIKQRRSIEVTPPEIQSPLWRYDFTMVWSGNNKQEAEIRQRTTEPRYELEVEVLPRGAHELVTYARDGCGGHTAAEAKVVEYLTARLVEIGEGLTASL